MPDGRVQAILRDITERKRAEEALRRSEESFRLLIERSPDLIAVHRGGRVVWANQSCARVFKTDLAKMIGRRVLDLVHPDDREAVRQRIVRQQQTGEPVAAMEERFVRDDGTVWYGEVVAIPLEFQGEPSSIVVAHDVTERKRAEEERRSLEQRIQQAQKLQSLGVLAGGIAHDFNNLLMGVLGNASLALLDLPPEAPARDHLQRVEVAARRAADLTRQLLAYSGRGRFLVKPLDLSKVVEEMNHLLATVISKRATVHLDFEKHLPPIEADATQMRQVIMNLITNASDSLGDEDGVIVIRTGLVHADASYLATTYVDEQLETGDYVYLEISDTGCGMDAATVERMFDPFFTTKFTGRGLGLAAVLGIVRGHRGAIKVDSEPGRGTSFRVLFPRAGGEVERFRAEERGALGRVGSGTIMVVDDEETVRSVARLVLERQGFAVVEAVDGVEAVELFRKQGSQIRLVVLDMTMPKMSGEEAFRALRSLDPDVRILLSSGYNEQEAVNHFAGRGLSGFIQKPYTSSELTDRVFQILGET
jgi:PAS domain S-box-containing protein